MCVIPWQMLIGSLLLRVQSHGPEGRADLTNDSKSVVCRCQREAVSCPSSQKLTARLLMLAVGLFGTSLSLEVCGMTAP